MSRGKHIKREKMGSSASVNKTEVQIISNVKEEEKQKPPVKPSSANQNNKKLSSAVNEESKTNRRESIEKSNAQLNQNLETKYKKLLEENEKLKKDLEFVQIEKNDLIDEINGLEDQLEIFTGQNNNNLVKDDFHKIIESKDKKIKELEDKLVLEEKNTNDMKLKYEEKLKKMKTKLDNLKQDNALKIVEMRDQLNECEKENETLNSKLNVISTDTGSHNDNTKLIIELSSHISEKEIIIMQLTSELEEKDTIIHNLEEDLKKFKKKSKNFDSEDEKSLKKHSDKSNRYNSAPSKSPVNMGTFMNSTRINVKEFAPNEVNTQNNEPTTSSTNLNIKTSIFNKNYKNSLNSSISSLSNA